MKDREDKRVFAFFWHQQYNFETIKGWKVVCLHSDQVLLNPSRGGIVL